MSNEPAPKYLAIRGYASFNRIVSGLTVCIGLLLAFSSLLDVGGSESATAWAAVGMGLCAALVGFWGIALSGLMNLAVDVATDIRRFTDTVTTSRRGNAPSPSRSGSSPPSRTP